MHLSTANWPNLKELNLSNKSIIKDPIKSMTKVVCIWVVESGRIFRNYISVINQLARGQ
jgi:hypothetical protein